MGFTAIRSRIHGVKAAAQQAACVNPASGLISWYRGEGTTGDAGGSNNGGAIGGVTYTTGRNGRGFSFDGTGEVVVPDANNLNPQNITLEVWVNPTLLDGNFDLIAAKETETSGTYHYEIAIRGPNGGGGKIPVGNLAFAINGIIGLPDDYLSWVDGSGAVPLNTWTHVALTNQTGKEVLSFALTADQVIAPYGTYLIAGSAYSLSVTAARTNGVIPDQQQAVLPFESAAGVALFAGLPTTTNRLDAAGMSFTNFSEGAPLFLLSGSQAEHAFVRRFVTTTQPQDTQDNRADFVLVAPTAEPINGQTPMVGSVAPRNRVMSPRK